jgi:hypothetical protein
MHRFSFIVQVFFIERLMFILVIFLQKEFYIPSAKAKCTDLIEKVTRIVYY